MTSLLSSIHRVQYRSCMTVKYIFAEQYLSAELGYVKLKKMMLMRIWSRDALLTSAIGKAIVDCIIITRNQIPILVGSHIENLSKSVQSPVSFVKVSISLPNVLIVHLAESN